MCAKNKHINKITVDWLFSEKKQAFYNYRNVFCLQRVDHILTDQKELYTLWINVSFCVFFFIRTRQQKQHKNGIFKSAIKIMLRTFSGS